MAFDRDFLSAIELLDVRVETPDNDTALLRNVPTNRRFFNKPSTNLLVKRLTAGRPLLVFVDDDLEYSGPDRTLADRFACGPTQAGWRHIMLASAPGTAQDAVEEAMKVLASTGGDPGPTMQAAQVPADDNDGVLAVHGTNLTELDRDLQVSPTIGRREAVDQAAAAVLRIGQMTLALIVGEPGVGKSNLLRGVAHRMRQSRPELSLICLDAADLFAGTAFAAERERILAALLREAGAASDSVMAVEHIDVVATQTAFGPLMLADAVDSGLRILGTTLPAYLPALTSSPVLGRRITRVVLSEADENEAVEILTGAGESIKRGYGLDVDQACLGACVHAAKPLPGMLPAKAIDLLHQAAACALLNKAEVLGLDDIYSVAQSPQNSQKQPD